MGSKIFSTSTQSAARTRLAAIWREFSAIDSGSIKWLFCDKLSVRGVRHRFACRVEGWERWGASRPDSPRLPGTAQAGAPLPEGRAPGPHPAEHGAGT